MELKIKNGDPAVYLPEKYAQLALKKGIEYNVTPSLFICQWWFESRFGTTGVATSNNNWGGTSWFYKATSKKRPSGVTAYRGTKRPKDEGAYYMKFSSIDDYMIDYFYLLLDGGTYDVRGHNNFNRSIQGLFRPKAKSNYARSGYSHYSETMRGIRLGINKRNDNILDKIDADPKKYYTGTDVSEKPGKPQEVDPPGEDDSNSTLVDRFDSFTEGVFKKLNDMLTVDLYDFDMNKSRFGNEHIQLIKQMDNMYKIKPTLSFENTFKRLISDGVDGLDESLQGLGGRPENPVKPIPKPPTDQKRVFPVDPKGQGINFWKKSNYKMGDLQFAMCYGWTRENGRRFHSAYDIGGGGVSTHKVYATTEGVVQFARWSDSGGFMIQIKHLTDSYYSTYMHLKNNSNLVKPGDKVKPGVPIATMSNTPGGGMAIHLHYVLSKSSKTYGEDATIDPEEYLGIVGDNKTSLPSPI